MPPSFSLALLFTGVAPAAAAPFLDVTLWLLTLLDILPVTAVAGLNLAGSTTGTGGGALPTLFLILGLVVDLTLPVVLATLDTLAPEIVRFLSPGAPVAPPAPVPDRLRTGLAPAVLTDTLLVTLVVLDRIPPGLNTTLAFGESGVTPPPVLAVRYVIPLSVVALNVESVEMEDVGRVDVESVDALFVPPPVVEIVSLDLVLPLDTGRLGWLFPAALAFGDLEGVPPAALPTRLLAVPVVLIDAFEALVGVLLRVPIGFDGVLLVPGLPLFVLTLDCTLAKLALVISVFFNGVCVPPVFALAPVLVDRAVPVVFVVCVVLVVLLETEETKDLVSSSPSSKSTLD